MSRRADLAVVLVAVAILLLLYAATRDARAGEETQRGAPVTHVQASRADVGFEASDLGYDLAFPGAPLGPATTLPSPAAALPSTGAPVTVPASPSGEVGTAIMAGNISWADPELGGDYLATRFPRGTLVRICATDTGICLVRRTNDFGPHAGIRPNRVADLAVLDWEEICRLDRERGLCPGTVETVEDFRLPATDTLYEGGTE